MIKLIKHTGECDYPDDPSLPFRLDLVMRPPSLMSVAFVVFHGGTEDFVVRSDSAEALVEWMHERDLRDHPRLIRFQITNAEGAVVYGLDRYDFS